jgi:N-acetylmuramic acid 6-phosphate etherase
MSDVFDELLGLETEARNPRSTTIDRMSVEDVLRLINSEDKTVPSAVEKEIPNIAKTVKFVIESFKSGGRLIYIGSGTSGRLGVLDASECPPTFGADPNMVIGIIAGGWEALRRSAEGAEDIEEAGARALDEARVTPKDTVIGLSASGRTPFVIGALDFAKAIGCKTVAISTNPRPKMKDHADITIAPVVGPEVLTGSTRMKSATAQKLILNMITTTAMIGIGKAYQNLMVDMRPWSSKLRERSKRIIMELAGVDYQKANAVFEKSGRDLKSALVMVETGVTLDEAGKLLKSADGHVFKAIELKRSLLASTKATGGQ